ncbi:MAG: hypothetical protein K2V38_11490, partial [Gemmataceae bacterium]|nr:hypothetical protein [Gemmataceae bacterium]
EGFPMQVLDLPDPKFTAESLGFSPDGRLLAAWSWGHAFVLDTETGTARGPFGERVRGRHGVPGVGFTADSAAVIVHAERGRNESSVWVIDLASGQVVARSPVGYAQNSGVEVGPGGQFVYLVHSPRERYVEIARWNPLTGESEPPVAGHKEFLRSIAVSADGRWVVGAGKSIRVWDLGGSKPSSRAARLFKLSGGSLNSVAVSADGAFVAFGRKVGAVATGELWEAAAWAGPTTDGRNEAFHPNRPLLALVPVSRQVLFYDCAARAEVGRFEWGIGEVESLAFSPDGLRCAAGAKGKVVVWDVDV